MKTSNVTVADFNKILQANGLKPSYRFDEEETTHQINLSSGKDILTAFDEGLKSLFILNELNENLNNLISPILENPEDFGINHAPTETDIKDSILNGFNNDSEFSIMLVPEKLKEDEDEDTDITIYPPENGEKSPDYWIWYIKNNRYFPGPIWLCVKRDGITPAFHYGYS